MRELLDKYGVVVVEGMNDVLRLEELHIAATALCSNKPTDAQVQTLAKFARQSANNKVTLFPDCDEPGEAGFKDLLWKLAEQQVEVRLGWSSTMFDGRFRGMQPEEPTDEEWATLV
ncbi:MAG: toprim domain-containing protein [Planctomycetaceae bacterium]|nr:toprim domain-containing protein [Planctomycetaceae bacterium]